MLNDAKGFSLIELMVTVSILLILAAISVPQYQKYKKKSQQVEAKNQLVSVYTAQKVFKAKNKTFFPNLWAIGYEPKGLVKYRAYISPTTSGLRNVQGYTSGGFAPNVNTDTYVICGTSFTNGVSDKCQSLSLDDGTPTLAEIGTVRNSFISTSSIFTVGTAHLFEGSDTDVTTDDVIDIWTINERKELLNIVNGSL